MNDGDVFNTKNNSCKYILGREEDKSFECFTQAQQVGAEKFITVGNDSPNNSGNIRMICLTAVAGGRHYELRSIHNFGPAQRN